MNRYRNPHGFTLIELMVVVVIIGILTALAIPRFNMASHKSKEKEADVMLKQIYTLQTAYLARNGVYATTQAELATVGYEPPPALVYYNPVTDYTLPVCMVAKGTWKNRGVDAQGTIDDC
jgi:prepilin-type N-terminal cleavage/methylation domain-containing protein